jgi:peptidoglycan/LPS O-acetylase OafA/YrhL
MTSSPYEVASIADVDRIRRQNNFDALRVLAAVFVIFGHGVILTGRLGDFPFLLPQKFEHVGVCIFFVISGYLITGSWERSHSVGQFISSRILRIMPLLVTVIVLSTFLLGPLVTTLSPGAYFSSGQTWQYLINIVFLPADGLPGVFAALPYPNAVNGSVWTLRAEVICYGVVLILGLLRRRMQTAGFVVFAMGSLVLVLAGPVIIAGSNVSAAANYWIYFAIGALLKLYAPRRIFVPWIAAVVFACWLIAQIVTPWNVAEIFSLIALPYFVLSFGLASTPIVRRTARFGDISYGIYLWAFPVQQLVVAYFGRLPFPIDLALVVTFAGALAFASWHLIEKRALEARFKLPYFKPSNQERASLNVASP